MDFKLGINRDYHEATKYKCEGACRAFVDATNPFIAGVISYPKDVAALIAHDVKKTGLVGTDAKNRAKLVTSLLHRAVATIKQNPTKSFEYLVKFLKNNKRFTAGRMISGAVTARFAGPVGGGSATAGALTGGGIRALNRVVDQMERGGIGTEQLSDVGLGAIAFGGSMGGNVNFDAKTGAVTATFEITATGSRLKQNKTIEICNVNEGC